MVSINPKKYRYSVLFIIALLLSQVIFSTNTDYDPEVINQAQVSIKITKTYELIIQKEIVTGIPETTGRRYTMQSSMFGTGTFVNGDGAILMGSEPNEDLFIEAGIDTLEPQILNDLGGIVHVKIFGIGITEEEKTSYSRYFKSERGSLYENYMRDRGIFGIKLLNEEYSAQIRETEIPAQLIEQTNETQIMQINGTGYPSISLGNNTFTQTGDLAYVIVPPTITNTPTASLSQNQTSILHQLPFEIAGILNPDPNSMNTTSPSQMIETVIITSINQSTFTVDKEVDPGAILLNENGSIIGIGIDGSDNVLKAEAAVTQLAKNRIVNSESKTTAAFKEGISEYEMKDYESAAKKFAEVVDSYPQHPSAKSFEVLMNQKSSLFEKVKSLPWIWILVACFGILAIGAIFSILPFGKRKRR